MRATTASPFSLHWLPPANGFADALNELRRGNGPCDETMAGLQSLANRDLDFMQTRRLDRALADMADRLPSGVPPLRLALLGSATLDHLAPGIRVGALRRGLLVEVYVAPYGQWRQQILDTGSELYAFEPNVVLLALDQAALVPELPLGASRQEVDDTIATSVEELTELWQMLRDRTHAAVVQQAPWSEEQPLFGHFEQMVPAAPGAVAARLDAHIAEAAAQAGVFLLDLQTAASGIGARELVNLALWHHAKQAVSPAAVPWVGDHIGRILAAVRGLSKKVLVLDLDNTLWGGTIGDDGLEGIVIGQGSGTGEAYRAFQRYVKRLAARGVVLAVSSKNDQAIAQSAFTEHPEMVLRLDDFAAFEANWHDKPSALCRVAEDLELGLDAMVFVDDNPMERDLMRRTLPQVAVPELPEAPELYARCIADAGYFETISFTPDDSIRNQQYVANRNRRSLRSAATDMESFLRDLQMTMSVGRFSPTDIARITQLINKTNQFNLTTRRYTEGEVRAMMDDATIIPLSARLTDKFGDNGLISIVIGRLAEHESAPALEIDTWLMSCRVLGRRVEEAMLTVLADEARAVGATVLVGRYRPTAKNGLVKEHYPKLGFAPQPAHGEGDDTVWAFPLETAPLPSIAHLDLVRMR